MSYTDKIEDAINKKLGRGDPITIAEVIFLNQQILKNKFSALEKKLLDYEKTTNQHLGNLYTQLEELKNNYPDPDTIKSYFDEYYDKIKREIGQYSEVIQKRFTSALRTIKSRKKQYQQPPI